MKYLLLLTVLLSFNVQAYQPISEEIMTGICIVLIDQIDPEPEDTAMHKFWKRHADGIDITVKQYHKTCVALVEKLIKNKIKESKKTTKFDNANKLM